MRKARCQLRYKFVRYENNFDDAAFISDAEKLPLNLVYAIDDTKDDTGHIFNKFSQTLVEHIPLKQSRSPVR